MTGYRLRICIRIHLMLSIKTHILRINHSKFLPLTPITSYPTRSLSSCQILSNSQQIFAGAQLAVHYMLSPCLLSLSNKPATIAVKLCSGALLPLTTHVSQDSRRLFGEPHYGTCLYIPPAIPLLSPFFTVSHEFNLGVGYIAFSSVL